MSEPRATFPDPASLPAIPVYDLLHSAARGYIGIDQRFIRAILGRGQDAVPDLLRFGLADHDDDRVDLEEDLISLFRSLNSPQALPFYIACVRHAPEDVPDDLVQAILPFGEKAVEPLLELYGELEEDQSADIAFLLANLGVRDPRIREILLDRLEYDAADGAFCLGLYGDTTVRPALEKIILDIPADDPDLRREIQGAIDQLDAPAAAPSPVQPEPIDLGELYPDEAPPPFEVLDTAEVLDMLESESATNRAIAAESFRNREVPPEAAAKLFEHATTDPDTRVRANCWEALADTETPSIRTAMKAVAGDASREMVERCGALVGLSGATDDPAVASRVREFYANPETRAKAMEAMWRSFDHQFAEFFPKHLDDPNIEIRRQAIWGTGYMDLGAESVRLKKLFDDDVLRQDALFAYSLCVPAEISRNRVHALLRKIDKAADGLSQAEGELVKIALDQRLVMHRMEPVFSEEDEDQADGDEPAVVASVGRNDPCPCGSGKKYKQCHG